MQMIGSVTAQAQLQWVITPLVMAAMVGLPFLVVKISPRIDGEKKASKFGVAVRIFIVTALWAILFFWTSQQPFWAKEPPAFWTRPAYIYGWPLPWKGEFAGLRRSILGLVFLVIDCFFWLWYIMFLCGFRRFSHFVKAVILGILGLFLFNLFLVGRLV